MYFLENKYMKGQNKLFFAIIIALIFGVIIGGVVNKFNRGVEIRINTEKVDEKNSATDVVNFVTTDGQKFSQKIQIVKDEKELSEFLKNNKSQDIIPLKMGAKTVFVPNVLKKFPDAQIKSVETVSYTHLDVYKRQLQNKLKKLKCL